MRWFSILGLMAVAACSTGAATPPSGSGGNTTSPTDGGGGASGGASGSGGAASGLGGATGAGGTTGTGGAGAGGTVSDGGTDANGDGSQACQANPVPSATSGVCAGMGTRVLTMDQAKIDDFEADTISPGWSSFDEPDNGGPHDVFKMTLVTTDGAATTHHSGEYKGAGIKIVPEGGFGAGTVYNVAIDRTGGFYCVDVSAFDGVSFWAKDAVAGKRINVSFVVPETNAQGAPGGDCQANCYQHPYKTITLTDQWAQYTVRFGEAGGGMAKVNGRIQELLFTTPDKDFDFHLDEIAFYKCTPPPGAVGP